MTTKEQLLRLMNHTDHSVAIKRTLNSGLLPSDLRKRWVGTFVKRGINEVLGKSGCPAWEAWATGYLSGSDLSGDSAAAALNSAREAMWNAAYSLDAKKHATMCAVYAITLAAQVAFWDTLGMVLIASEAAVKAASLRPCPARLTGRPAAWLALAAAWLFKRDGKHIKAVAEADETKKQYDDLLAIINEMP
jgi:hypothetical protein